MHAYKPSNKAPITGIFILLAISIFAGILLGLLTFAISKLIYLIIIFPLGLGIIGGALIGTVGVRRGKMRNPIIGGLFGLLIGLTIYGSFRYAQYNAFRNELRGIIRQEIEQGFIIVDPDMADDIIDQFLFEETGSSGIWGYLKLAAIEGESFGRMFGGQSINIGPTLTWLYWIVELGIIAGIAMSVGYSGAKEPFCETCQEWFGPRTVIGNVKAASTDLLLQTIQIGNFSKVHGMIQENAVAPSADVSILECSCVANDSVLLVESVTINNKGKLEYKTLLQNLIQPAQRDELFQQKKTQDDIVLDEIDAFETTPVPLAEKVSDFPFDNELATETKDYTRTRIFLIIAILLIVLPFLIGIFLASS
ncbi:hypothetical protein [Candidatus Leptofilum sp.]|uniref:hypothetical protein n=1 Tax=Candidatus Leptofilum sp. TaxID=3241576 RepID=UPI003B599FC0